MIDGVEAVTQPVVYDPGNICFGSGGEDSLTDGVTGRISGEGEGYSWLNGTWFGIEGTDLTITVDLKNLKNIRSLSMGFLDEWPSGIRYPEYVKFSTSVNGRDFTEYATLPLNENCIDTPARMKTVTTAESPMEARYIRVFIKNGGSMPLNSPAGGNPSWFFFDELTIDAENVTPTQPSTETTDTTTSPTGSSTETTAAETDSTSSSSPSAAVENTNRERRRNHPSAFYFACARMLHYYVASH